MDTDLDTLAIALYVTVEELLAAHPERAPARPAGSFRPRISDAELVVLAVMQNLLSIESERRWVRYASKHLLDLFPDLPQQPGYHKRQRRLGPTVAWLTTALAGMVSVADDDVWVADSTPVECARSVETVKRSELAGWAEYGYCASHSRFFWGLRLHLVCTMQGLPLAWALTGAKADERQVLSQLLDTAPALNRSRQAVQTLITDKGYYGRGFTTELDEHAITLLRPARKGEPVQDLQRFFKPLRQVIESIIDSLKGQLSLERHAGRTIAGVCARVSQRILALVAAIWHNDRAGAPILRSLTAYDH